MKIPKLRICKLCKNPQSLDKFYKLTPRQYDCYCKQCRISFQMEKNEAKIRNKWLTLLNYYEQFPQFDYTQAHSLAVLCIFNRLQWPKIIEYLNEKYSAEYTYKEAYLFLSRIKSYRSRYFTYKKCINCEETKQTYVNSDNVSYVFTILEDVRIPIIEKDFSLAPPNRDGWSLYCKNCDTVLSAQKERVRTRYRKPVDKAD